VEAGGSVYSVGYFEYPTDFDPTEGMDMHESAGEEDAFVTKVRSDGSYAWTRSFGGAGVGAAYGVAVRADGGIVVTGGFTDTVDFDPTSGLDERSATGEVDGFLTRFGADGAYLGTTQFLTGDGKAVPNALALDRDENLLVTGNSYGQRDFDPGPALDIHSSTSYDIFVTKFSANGSYAWTRMFGGNGWDIAKGVCADAEGNVLVGGTFRGTADFDPSDGVDIHTGLIDSVFVTKFLPDGSYAWTRTIPVLYNYGNLACGPSGESVVTGLFTGTVDFDPTDGVDSRTAADDPTGVGAGDVFVTKLNADGSYGWTYTLGGVGGDQGSTAAVSNEGNVFVGGDFRDQVDFDAGPGNAILTSNGHQDAFLMLLSPEGTFRWARSFGSGGIDGIGLIAIGPTGELVVGGTYRSTVDFAVGCPLDERSTRLGLADSFLTKMVCLEPTADADRNGSINLRDYAAFENCFTGPAPTVCKNGCESFDFDHTDDIDLPDLPPFVNTVTGP